MIERWASRTDSSAHASVQARSPATTLSSATGWSRRSTSAHPSAAKRFDIDATWMRATSPATPLAATAGGSSAHAATRRPKSGCSRWLSGSSTTARAICSSTDVSASSSAALPEAATAAIASGWTKASEPSRMSSAATRASNRGPVAAPGPPHEASPTRCPRRRVNAKASTAPSSPSSSRVSSSARSTLARNWVTSSRPNSWWGRVRLSTKSWSGSLRRSIRQSAIPLLASFSGNA